MEMIKGISLNIKVENGQMMIQHLIKKLCLILSNIQF